MLPNRILSEAISQELKSWATVNMKHGLKVEADKVSATHVRKLKKVGGTITLREKGVTTKGVPMPLRQMKISGRNDLAERARGDRKEESAEEALDEKRNRGQKRKHREELASQHVMFSNLRMVSAF